MAEEFTLGGQTAWFHDHGFWGGFFHTYNQFQVGEGAQPRKVHIFLPRDYEVSQEHYPVMYINDGDTAFFPGGAYYKTWELGTILTRMYLVNRIRKMIVVAVSPVNRDYEYTHAPVWDREWGGLHDYAHYLAFAVKGFVDTHYRTMPQREHNLVLGASHGGLAAFYTATQYPEQFGCVAALSPSFWVGLDSMTDINLLKGSESFFGSLEFSSLLFATAPALQNRERRLKIYLDWGLVREGGFHNRFIEERATARGREMRELLIKNFGYQENENLFVVEDAIGQHSEESWSGRMDNILKIFFGN